MKIKIKKDKHDKNWYLYIGKDILAHFVNDWVQIFGKWNWYEFRIIEIYFENDMEFVPGYEFNFVVFGLGFRIRYNKSWHPQWKELIKRTRDYKK